MKRKIYLYGPNIQKFWQTLDHATIEKIEWTIEMIKELDRVPSRYLKYLKGTDAIYEIRCAWFGRAVRLFCFFDEGQLIIVIHGFIKKTEKTPANEIRIAEKIKKEYYEQKSKK